MMLPINMLMSQLQAITGQTGGTQSKAMMPNLDERLPVKYLCVINVPLSGIKGMLMYAFTKGGDAKPSPG